MILTTIKRNFVETARGQMHYRLAGIGNPLVMLHQVPLSSVEFCDVLPGLAEKRQVITPDLLGYGCSDPPNRGMDIPAYAAGIIEMLDALGIDRCDLLGVHSGASVANEIAAAFPERIRKLIVIGAAAWEDWQDRYQMFARCQPFLFDAEGESVRYQWGRLTLYTDKPHIFQRFITEKVKASPLWYTAYVAVFTYDFITRFRQVKAPLLFLVGEKDFLAENTACLKALRPDAAEKVIEDGSVWLAWDKPAEFIESVEEFLDGP
jgi:pimeloyl-ACP methyl ester carboxylesterase